MQLESCRASPGFLWLVESRASDLRVGVDAGPGGVEGFRGRNMSNQDIEKLQPMSDPDDNALDGAASPRRTRSTKSRASATSASRAAARPKVSSPAAAKPVRK